MKEAIQKVAASLTPYLIEVRHYLHAHPELSFDEHNTMKYVCEQLSKYNIPFQSGIADTGIVVLIEGKNPTSKCVALRADMDALPIQEKNEVPYKSTNDGVMHACGHDVHTTCLIGAAIMLNQLKDTFEGTLKLIFQPGEEKAPGGASLMIAAGVLQNPAPSAIVGLHVYPELPAGIVAFKNGSYMASADEIYITVKGKGGHAALPNKAIDPITISAEIISTMQQIISRRSNPLIPAVLTFGKIQGGFTNNVIPDEVKIEGTLRTFDETFRAEAKKMIVDISQNIASAFGATAEVFMPGGYPSLYNNPDLTDRVRSIAEDFMGKEQVDALTLRMTAEDFAFYTREIPGCFFRLGTNHNNELYTNSVHTPNFNIDEKAITIGASLMAYIGFKLMQN